MKTPLLLLFLAPGNFVLAQDEPGFPDMRSWMLSNNDTAGRYIFADTALIRVSPDTRQSPIDTLLVKLVAFQPTIITLHLQRATSYFASPIKKA